jgi:hypothetical protein
MPAKRNCVPSAKIAVDPIAAIGWRFHSPFKRSLLSDLDCPQRQSDVLYVARLDRIFRSSTVVRRSARANSRWRSTLVCQIDLVSKTPR